MAERTGWRRIVVEAVVIVASILLAFGIDAAWDNRNERAEERILLEGLRDELSANRQLLNETLDTVRLAQQDLDTFAAMTPEEAASMPDSVRSRIGRRLFRTYVTELSYGFLTATVNSGKLALIRDPFLRASLTGLASLDEDATEPSQMISRVTEAASIIQARYTFGRSEAVRRTAMGAMRSDEELMGLLGHKVMAWTGYSVALGVLRDRIEDVIGRIDTQLN